MTDHLLTVTSHAGVCAVLADPRFVVPVAAPAETGVGWLRAHVARFSTGAAHQRRRGLAVAELDALDPGALRRAAAREPGPVERVAVTVLARALGVAAQGVAAQGVANLAPVALGGVEGDLVDDVRVVAAGYHPGTDAGPGGDAAVARLVGALGGRWDEATAARIGLLVQACDATAGLIVNALALDDGTAPVHAVLAETLRYDPPVRGLRRVATERTRIAERTRTGDSGAMDVEVDAGGCVHLDLGMANRDPAVFAEPDRFDPHRSELDRQLTLSVGLRPCPGRDHAFAIASGVLDAARR